MLRLRTTRHKHQNDWILKSKELDSDGSFWEQGSEQLAESMGALAESTGAWENFWGFLGNFFKMIVRAKGSF